MPRSQPIRYMPVRSSDVDTRRPLPVRSRSYSAAMIPATVVMPVAWSPTALRTAMGIVPGGTWAAAIDERAQNAPMS